MKKLLLLAVLVPALVWGQNIPDLNATPIPLSCEQKLEQSKKDYFLLLDSTIELFKEYLTTKDKLKKKNKIIKRLKRKLKKC